MWMMMNFNNYRYEKFSFYIGWILFLVGLFILFGLYSLYFGDVLYCDPGSNSGGGPDVLHNRGESDQNESDQNESDGCYPSESRVLGVLFKYNNKLRRRFYWVVCERDRRNYNSYGDFKNDWDPNLKIRNELKVKFNKWFSGSSINSNTRENHIMEDIYRIRRREARAEVRRLNEMFRR